MRGMGTPNPTKRGPSPHSLGATRARIIAVVALVVVAVLYIWSTHQSSTARNGVGDVVRVPTEYTGHLERAANRSKQAFSSSGDMRNGLHKSVLKSPAASSRANAPYVWPGNFPDEPPERDFAQIAVTVLLTSSAKHAQTVESTLGPTLDSLMVFKDSIESFRKSDRQWAAKRSKPALVSERPLNVTYIAFASPEVHGNWIDVVKWMGFDVRRMQSPVKYGDIRNEQTRHDIKEDGATGITEMIKLEAMSFTEFDRVLMLDCDILMHKPIRHILIDFDNNSAPHTNRTVFAWTKGALWHEKMNGGFLVFNPRADGRKHMNAIYDILKEGDFNDERGWRNSGLGNTYGGRTVQGLMPYYFLGALGPGYADVELDRCKYNNMAELPECYKKPFDFVVSNHFTSPFCQKPFRCTAPTRPLCHTFMAEWYKRWFKLREKVAAGLNDRLLALRVESGNLGCSTGRFEAFTKILFGHV